MLDPIAAGLFADFAAAGIDALLLKGAALARLLYQPDERRPYIDIDVLVAPQHLDHAGSLLSELGYRNATHLRGIEDVGSVVHGDTWFSPAGARPHEIDVHRWLAGARAAPETAWEALWRHRTVVEVAGQQLPVLDREGQALHLALHTAQHGPGYFKGTRELSLALERWPPEVWREARSLARELDAEAAFAAGLRLVPDGVALAQELDLPAEVGLEWEIAHRAERPRGTFHVEALRRAGGIHERGRLLRKALLPNRRWLAIEYHWSERGGLWLALAYALHLARTPVWGVKAWTYRRRARRAAGSRQAD